MNYTANDVASHFQKYSDHISHYAVMHTKLRSANKSQKTRESYVEQTNKNLHYALQVFETKIHDGHINRARRKPEIYKPLSFATIEGAYETTNNELTVHVNLLLGNLPTHLNDAHIYQCLTYAWLYKANQSDDLSFYNIANDNQSVCRALNYSVKEGRANRERLWSTNGIWSVQNCWIPHQALD
jgi:hypothetical protein